MPNPIIEVYRHIDGSIEVINPFSDEVDVIVYDYDVDTECYTEGDETLDGVICIDDDGDLFARSVY